MRVISAKHFRTGGNYPISRVVIHRAECPLRVGRAESVARYFQSPEHPASAHYVVGPEEVVACVFETDVAFHAPPNTHSIGVEFLGYSAENDWDRGLGPAMVNRGAELVADICRRHSLPAVWLSVEDLKAGKSGITGHKEVSLAFKKSTHVDPGDFFPRDNFLLKVATILHGGKL